MGFVSNLGEIFKILKHIFRMVFKRPFTSLYPFEDRIYPERTRGRHIHVRHACTACSQCVRACPVVAITIDKTDKLYEKDAALTFDYTRCIFCGLCVDACRFDSLFHTPVVDMSEGDRESLQYDSEEITTLDREPLEWRGRRFR